MKEKTKLRSESEPTPDTWLACLKGLKYWEAVVGEELGVAAGEGAGRSPRTCLAAAVGVEEECVVLALGGCCSPLHPEPEAPVSGRGGLCVGVCASACVRRRVAAGRAGFLRELGSAEAGEFPVASQGTKGTEKLSALLFSERVGGRAGRVFLSFGSVSLSVRTSSLAGAPTFSAWSCFGSVKTNGVWGLPGAAGLGLMLGYGQGKLFLSFECGSSVVQGQSLFNSFCIRSFSRGRDLEDSLLCSPK